MAIWWDWHGYSGIQEEASQNCWSAYRWLPTVYHKWLTLHSFVSDDWKLSKVIPVQDNNGDVDFMSNYHPFSVIGHIANMVKQLVQLQRVTYLEGPFTITPLIVPAWYSHVSEILLIPSRYYEYGVVLPVDNHSGRIYHWLWDLHFVLFGQIGRKRSHLSRNRGTGDCIDIAVYM